MPTLEERLARAEKQLSLLDHRCRIIENAGNIVSPGNLYLIGERFDEDGNENSFEDPTKIEMGPSHDTNLYVAVQKKASGWWIAIRTFLRGAAHLPVTVGYGRLPMEIATQGWKNQENGISVQEGLVVKEIWLQQPKHMNMQTGRFEIPAEYRNSVPYTAAGEVMGGIDPSYDDLVVRLTSENGELVLRDKHGQYRLRDLVNQ